MPGKGSVDKFASIYVYVFSCKLIAIIIEDENESCEKDEDCKPQLTCVKHSHVYIYNKTEEKFSIQDIPKNKTTGKCMDRPGRVANLFPFLFVFNFAY